MLYVGDSWPRGLQLFRLCTLYSLLESLDTSIAGANSYLSVRLLTISLPTVTRSDCGIQLKPHLKEDSSRLL